MKSLGDLKERFKRVPSDMVGIDVGHTGTKVVRLHRNGDAVTLSGAAVLPPVPRRTDTRNVWADARPLTLPPRLRARSACVAIPGRGAVVKLLSLPGAFDAAAESRLVEHLGLKEPAAYRVSYSLLSEGHGRSESRVLAVAVPEAEAAVIPHLLPSGLPAPESLELSGLATLTAFLQGPCRTHEADTVGILDFGSNLCHVAIFNKRVLTLVRRMEFGLDALTRRVQESLGVDAATAEGIIRDGSFDISKPVAAVMEPLTKQLVVSRDFVERRENCSVRTFYVSGAVAHFAAALGEIRSAMEADVIPWNPIQGLTVARDALPKELEGQEWRP